MKIFLLNLNHSDKDNFHVIERVWPPLSLLNCAALLRKNNWQVYFLENALKRYNSAKVAEIAGQSSYVLIATNPIDRWQCPTLEIDNYFEVVKTIRRMNKDIRIITYGPHVQFKLEKMLDYADFVIQGEPEAKVLHLYPEDKGLRDFAKIQGVFHREANRIIGEESSSDFDFDKLQMPAFDLVRGSQYCYPIFSNSVMLLEFSRGCPHRCTFCLGIVINKGVRHKKVESLLSEIIYIKNELKIKDFIFIDLDFLADKSITKRLLKRIIAEKLDINWACDVYLDSLDDEILYLMRQAGCRLIHVGIESGSPRIQKFMGKGLNYKVLEQKIKMVKKHKIDILGYFRLGYLGESKLDMLETIRYAKGLALDYVSFARLIPYPGTKFYSYAKEHIRKKSSFDIGYGYEKYLTSEELDSMLRKANIAFYLRISYIFKHFPKLILHPSRLLYGLTLLFRRLVFNRE